MIHNSSRLIQFAWETNNTKCGYRRSDDFGSTWTPWSRNYDDSILADSTVLSPLASALGAEDSVTYDGENVNVNTLKGTRAKGLTRYTIVKRTATITGLPSELDSEGVVMIDVEPVNGGYDIKQTAYSRSGTAFYRFLTQSGGVATNWGRVDGYGITSLSGLASALGAVTHGLQANQNLNDIDGGWWTCFDGSIRDTISNKPAVTGHDFFVFSMNMGYGCMQFFGTLTDDMYYIRTKYNATWRPWVKIPFT